MDNTFFAKLPKRKLHSLFPVRDKNALERALSKVTNRLLFVRTPPHQANESTTFK